MSWNREKGKFKNLDDRNLEFCRENLEKLEFIEVVSWKVILFLTLKYSDEYEVVGKEGIVGGGAHNEYFFKPICKFST